MNEESAQKEFDVSFHGVVASNTLITRFCDLRGTADLNPSFAKQYSYGSVCKTGAVIEFLCAGGGGYR